MLLKCQKRLKTHLSGKKAAVTAGEIKQYSEAECTVLVHRQFECSGTGTFQPKHVWETARNAEPCKRSKSSVYCGDIAAACDGSAVQPFWHFLLENLIRLWNTWLLSAHWYSWKSGVLKLSVDWKSTKSTWPKNILIENEHDRSVKSLKWVPLVWVNSGWWLWQEVHRTIRGMHS